ILLDRAREKGFKGLVAPRGDTALRLAKEFPPSAVTLDIRLPDIDGWSILARFKKNLATRHIPVEIISGDGDRMRGLNQGALGFLEKPVSKEALDKAFKDIHKCLDSPARQLLLVCAKQDLRKKLKEMLESEGVKVHAVSGSQEALPLLKEGNLDCVALELPDAGGFRVLQAIHANPQYGYLPMIAYISGEMSKKDEEELRRTAKVCVIREAKSEERLMDGVVLFLHQEFAKLPEAKRDSIEKMHQSGDILTGRKVLVVDDDIRNIFAMTSLLEHQQMKVLSAESGREAIELLEKTPDMDIVLMDIMMPEMDGYDTMQAIRQKESFKSLPIVALTAKAMKGDREKCIESGASDYITKPVDTEQLLSLMRTWLNR
ncbi:MAG TPA: response regulator, partial [bacterium]|nr:response regulator [bacterium]